MGGRAGSGFWLAFICFDKVLHAACSPFAAPCGCGGVCTQWRRDWRQDLQLSRGFAEAATVLGWEGKGGWWWAWGVGGWGVSRQTDTWDGESRRTDIH